MLNLGGRLLGEQFLERHLSTLTVDAEATSFVAGLRQWRWQQESFGPASSEHSLLEASATPLTALLGFHTVDDLRALDHGWIAARVASPEAAVTLIVAGYGSPLDRASRRAAREASARGTEWAWLFNGTQLRLVYAGSAGSHRFTEVDLDAAADDEPTALALWTIARSSALGSGAGATTIDLVRLSDRYGTDVCRALRNGVRASSSTVLEAILSRVKRARVDDAFAQSLTLIYRLLFLCFAEARGLVPTWHHVYRDSYSVGRLADAAADPSSHGLWDAVQALGRLAHTGCRAGDLRVTAYNGRLFKPGAAPLVEAPRLPERAARDMLMALTTRPGPGDQGRERISYRDLGVEQLGAVYETLLDYAPDPAAIDRLRRGRDTPNGLLTAGSDVRKRTGSFYTPEPIARFLVRRTLGPLVDGATPQRILNLRVLDPSMGSGAFLVAACRYLADAYVDALVASGECMATDLGVRERALIRRTIAERCLFGVDLNPMAVQLAQLSLWLASLASERPLGFLDHHLVTGNSLVGAWLTSLTRAPQAKTSLASLPLFDDEPMTPMLSMALPVRFSLSRDPTDTAAQVRAKERSLQMLNGATTLLSRWKALASVWVARWLDPDLRELSSLYPSLADELIDGHATLPSRTTAPFLARAATASSAFRVFHWELEFPEVFFDAAGTRRADAGFDAIIGNPPWEMLRADSDGASGTTQLVRFARDSGVYRACRDGHANCYQLFVERSLALLAPEGRLGMVLPSGIAVDHGSAALRRMLFSTSRVESLAGFENRRAIFDIHRSVKFVLISVRNGGTTEEVRCRLGETSADVLERACDERGALDAAWWPLRLSPSLLERLSGPALAIPDIRSTDDLRLAARLADRFPPLGAEHGWNARFGRELNATEDRGLFSAAGREAMPVIEGKHVDPFTVRRRDARYSIGMVKAQERLGDCIRRARLAYRDVASATNRVTLIAAILPACTVSTHTVLCLKTSLLPSSQHYLCGVLNSYVVNYLARMRVTTHVTTAIVEQLPVPTECEAGPAFGVIAAMAKRLAMRRDPALLACIQAHVARLYGLTVRELTHVLDTFPLVDQAERDAVVRAFEAL